MTLVALCFAITTLTIDFSAGASWLPKWAYLFSGGSDGARNVVGVIAGSIITVAGVTFSISIVILSLASQQYGSRLLRNFTRDRSLHFIMGAFIATYVFCILILPSIHGGDDVGRVEFIPRISVTICVAAAIADVFVLIFFIHHVSRAIQAAFLTSSAQQELLDTLHTLFPEQVEEGTIRPEPTRFEALGFTRSIAAKRSGYFQSLNIDQLMAYAERMNSTFKILVRPGEYIVEGDSIMEMHSPAEPGSEPGFNLEKCFTFGYRRTMDQDPAFGFDMLVEMGVRALSPGINDPFTAIQCIDHLREGLKILAKRERINGYYRGKGERVCIIFPSLNFQQSIERTIPVFEYYSKRSPTVLLALKEMLIKLEKDLEPGDDRIFLQTKIQSVHDALREMNWK